MAEGEKAKARLASFKVTLITELCFLLIQCDWTDTLDTYNSMFLLGKFSSYLLVFSSQGRDCVLNSDLNEGIYKPKNVYMNQVPLYQLLYHFITTLHQVRTQAFPTAGLNVYWLFSLNDTN